MINNAAKYAEFLPRLREADWIAIDTEADSLHAYPEKLCLLQISLPGADELIDPLVKMDLSGLLEIFKQRELTLHGADYDLRLLHWTYHLAPGAIFDTMSAARLLGQVEFGLRDLVWAYLGVRLEKGPQKMNWAKRPLTERMEAYARNDTHYLQPLATLLREQLRERGRLGWHEEICSKLISESARPKTMDLDLVWRVKGSDRLDRCGLAVLRELWRWRETEAMRANKPPYFVLSHEELVHAADRLSRNRSLRESMPPRLKGPRAEHFEAAAAKARAVLPAHYPERRRTTGQRLTRTQQRHFEEVRKRRDLRAAELAIDPSLIASRGELVALALDEKAGRADLMRWQRELLFAPADNSLSPP